MDIPIFISFTKVASNIPNIVWDTPNIVKNIKSKTKLESVKYSKLNICPNIIVYREFAKLKMNALKIQLNQYASWLIPYKHSPYLIFVN